MVAAVVPGTAPLGVVKRNEQEFRDWVATEVGFATAFGSWSESPIRLENYQLAFLQCGASFRCTEKSRQSGYSWIFALEAFARSHLRETHTAVFVSYNLADAKEKIAYCRQLHEELPLEYQRRLVVDSKLELGFRVNSGSGKVSRIISNPSKAPRGKHGDIYLDELAHCANDREIYKGSTALIVRSHAQLTICSSPLGRRGMFWEIAREELRPYKQYHRQCVPWWLCSEFCNDVEAAAREAPGFETEERVGRFGKTAIVEQFDSMALEDFQQEYEVFYSDETLTYFPYELILACCQLEDEDLAEDYAQLSNAKGRLVGGYDVGRKKDMAELAIFEQFKDGRQRCRMLRTFDRVPFQTQEAELKALLTIVPMGRLSIDATGMGMQLAENLQSEFPAVVVSEGFTNTSKEVWATDFKIHLQQRLLELPRMRDLIGQIHSIRRHVTGAGRVIFDVDRSTTGHADKFWACALATRKERGPSRQLPGLGVHVIG